MKRALVTGSSGLIGSEAVAFFDERGFRVVGVDNNMRRDFFGEPGDTTWNLERLQRTTTRFEHRDLDVRDREGLLRLVAEVRPDLIVHCAAQPSHDLAASRPFDDFEVNALGTLNLLEAARRSCPESPFVFLSTNKVYGDAPNELELVELESRWDYADSAYRDGIDETMRIDGTMHSLFGASKVAADVLVQEYGRYFGMPTVCFRGGCLTGPNHSGAELHGFLAYLARALRDGLTYRIYGYKGKQVRDNIHSYDVCTAILAFYERPESRRCLQPRRRPREQRLGARGDRSASKTVSAGSSHASTSTSRGAATTSATSATLRASEPITPSGSSASRSTRSSTSSSGSRRRRRRPDAQ